MAVQLGGINLSMDCLVAICGNLDRRTKMRFRKPFDFDKKTIEKCSNVLNDFEHALNKYEMHDSLTKYLACIEVLKQTKKIDANVLRAYNAKIPARIRDESLREINVESLELITPQHMIVEYPNAEVLSLEFVKYTRTITKATLQNCQLLDEWIMPLTYLSQLTHLNLTFNPDLTGKYIAEIGRLSHLNITNCENIRASYMREIVESHQLEELIAPGCPVLARAADTYDITQIWTQLENLNTFSMNYPINKCGYDFLGCRLLNLKVLACTLEADPATLLSTLRTHAVIEELTINGTELETVNVALLIGMRNLTKIHIRKCKLDFDATKLVPVVQPLPLEEEEGGAVEIVKESLQLKLTDCMNYQSKVLSALVQQCEDLKTIDIDDNFDDVFNDIAQEVLNIAHFLEEKKTRDTVCINISRYIFEDLNDMEIEMLKRAENFRHLKLTINNQKVKLLRKTDAIKPFIELYQASEEVKNQKYKIVSDHTINCYRNCPDKKFANALLQTMSAERLEIYEGQMAELNFLRYMPTITVVFIRDCNLKDKDMEPLIWLPNLRNLDISCNALLTGRYINECGCLNDLNITKCKAIRAFWMYEIAKNNQLVDLEAYDCPVFSEAHNTHYLQGAWLHLTNITVLRMNFSDNMCGLKYLSYWLPNLRELYCRITEEPITLLSTLCLITSVEELHLHAVDRIKIVNLAFLAKMKNLRALNLRHFRLEFDAKKKKSELSSSLLYRIQFSECTYFENEILSSMLKRFPKLRRIDLLNEDPTEYEAILADLWKIAKSRTEKSKELLVTCDKNLFNYCPDIDRDKVEHIKKVINLEFDDFEDFEDSDDME